MRRWTLLLLAALLPLACDVADPTDPTEPVPPVEPPPTEPPPEAAGPAHFVSAAWSEARREAVLSGPTGIATHDPATGATRTVSTVSAGGRNVMLSDLRDEAYFVAARPGEEIGRAHV